MWSLGDDKEPWSFRVWEPAKTSYLFLHGKLQPGVVKGCTHGCPMGQRQVGVLPRLQAFQPVSPAMGAE